jgi:L-lactate dehydrogenase complex protein LldG
MNAETFLDSIAKRLGRPRSSGAPARPELGAIDHEPVPDLVDRFQAELQRVGGVVFRCANERELQDRLFAVIADTKAETIVSWSRSELASFTLDRLWSSNLCTPWEGGSERERARFHEKAAHADTGLTSADLAVASTGSIVLCGGATRPRSVRLLPSMHVEIVPGSRFVARMSDAFDVLARRTDVPSSVIFVTGPSRTSDIENDLTIGVHGPASVVVLVLQRA